MMNCFMRQKYKQRTIEPAINSARYFFFFIIEPKSLAGKTIKLSLIAYACLSEVTGVMNKVVRVDI